MTTSTFKILLFMKRKPGMSVEAFRAYYEEHHAPFCAKYSTAVSRYFRRYVEPQDHPETGSAAEFEFDVITELWFDDEQTFRSTLGYITASIMPEEVISDEQNLFDRTSFRIATVVERETDLAGINRP